MSDEWVMVPREPTANQLVDGAYEVPDPISHRGELTARMVYRAMLDAAPAAPVQQADPVAWTVTYNGASPASCLLYESENEAMCRALNDGNGCAILPLYLHPPAAEVQRLRDAAKAVVARWDSPAWKNEKPTAAFINELRRALEGE